MIYIIIAIVVLLVIYVLTQYNSFVKLRNTVKEAFSTMDIYLKKRWDLIPNLVETVKGYAKHESETLEKIVQARNLSYDKMSETEKIEANQTITSGLSKLIVIAENYPELKANGNFTQLMAELSKTEEDIANSRKYYNGVVKEMNTKIEMFPSNIVAAIFGFKQSKMFETSEEERNNVKVSF